MIIIIKNGINKIDLLISFFPVIGMETGLVFTNYLKA